MALERRVKRGSKEGCAGCSGCSSVGLGESDGGGGGNGSVDMAGGWLGCRY